MLNSISKIPLRHVILVSISLIYPVIILYGHFCMYEEVHCSVCVVSWQQAMRCTWTVMRDWPSTCYLRMGSSFGAPTDISTQLPGTLARYQHQHRCSQPPLICRCAKSEVVSPCSDNTPVSPSGLILCSATANRALFLNTPH